MTRLIAALPMYDWPESRAETDEAWGRVSAALRDGGIEAPARLARRNADMPPVPGGIRDPSGVVIAPDPASLPPDGFDLHTLWRHPSLLLAQTCWGPMEQGLSQHVTVVGQPSYDGVEGGQGEFYSSALLMRRSPSPLRGGSDGVAGRGGGLEDQNRSLDTPTTALSADPPLKGEGVAPRSDGSALLPFHLLRNQRLAYNGADSMSGIIALTRDLEAAGESLDIFSERIVSGAHRASIVAVADGRADVCAIDCRSWQMAKRFEPRASDVAVVGWTARRKGLPMVTSFHTPSGIVDRLRAVLGGFALAQERF